MFSQRITTNVPYCDLLQISEGKVNKKITDYNFYN